MNNKYENIKASEKVVVCVNAKAHTTKSGLVLQNTDNKPETGEVIVFGTGKKPIEFKVGDTIVFRRYTDNRIILGAVEYNFVLFKDVLGVISK
jgi:co-chaperonin GroES (HSP10)